MSLAALAGVRLEAGRPVRSFPSYRGQRNYPGWYWSATMCRRVGFESWVERDHLVALDFDPAVTAVASQPFWLLWQAGGKVRRHAPDFFARLAGAGALVVDSRPLERIGERDREAFAAAGAACARLGWRYAVWGSAGAAPAANLRWLAGYRHPRCHDEAVAGRLREVFARPRALMDGAAVIDAQAGTSTGTRSRVIRQVLQRLEEEHGPGVVPVPSRATFYRLLQVLSAGRHTFGSAVTRRQTAARPGGVFTATIAARPGEQVQLDGTPDIRQITTTGSKLIINNRGKQLGRRGLIVSGPSGTGKSTSITQLGRKHQIETERRHPGLAGRIPVVYIIVPPAATPKTLAIELAAFLGLPVSSRDSQHAITQAVAGVLRKVGCSLVLVDEVHRLDLRTRSGAEASDQLKYFFDSIGATFVYAGLDLEENGMFSGMRGRQIAGRFISVRTKAFGHATASQRTNWAKLIATMEQTLRLRHKPGSLIEMAPYLHQRTGGMIGSLDQLIHEAANDAIGDGTEKITASTSMPSSSTPPPRSNTTSRPPAARPPPAAGPDHEPMAVARPRPAGHLAAPRRGNHHLLLQAARRGQRPVPDRRRPGARPGYPGQRAPSARPRRVAQRPGHSPARGAVGAARHRLATALPALRWGPPRWFPLPEDIPALRCYRPFPAARPACRPCALRACGATTARPLVRPQASPLLCRRHLRWLGPVGDTAQADISAAPEILTAHRRYQQILTRNSDPEWAAASIGTAWAITTHWAHEPYRRPRLRSRWQDRAAKLGLTSPPGQPAVTFPEAVTLAQVLTDLDWRRHAAMVHEWQLDRFYWRIALRLGEPSCRFPSRSDPIVTWTARHRSRFAPIRDSFWSSCELVWASSTPFPEKASSNETHENWPTRRSEHGRWPDATRNDRPSAARVVSRSAP